MATMRGGTARRGTPLWSELFAVSLSTNIFQIDFLSKYYIIFPSMHPAKVRVSQFWGLIGGRKKKKEIAQVGSKFIFTEYGSPYCALAGLPKRKQLSCTCRSAGFLLSTWDWERQYLANNAIRKQSPVRYISVWITTYR